VKFSCAFLAQTTFLSSNGFAKNGFQLSEWFGGAYELYKPRCTNAVRKNFFTERVVNVLNSLPHNVDFSSLPKLKIPLHKLIFLIFSDVWFNCLVDLV